MRRLANIKFILYGCAECTDDEDKVILFAVQRQNGVMTPVSCPICVSNQSIVALREIEIET